MSAIFGETLVFGQQEGPDVELVVFGDEFYARYETKDGFTVVYDPDLGRYAYAVVLDGRFASSGVPISKQPPLEIRRHLKESERVRNEKFEQRYTELRPPEPPAAPHVILTLGRNNGLLDGRRVSEGPVLGLTVLVEFADMEASVTAADVDALLNEDNYTANGNFCSVREYFRLVSNEKLDYANMVVGPVKLSQKRSHYISQLFVKEALDIVVHNLGVDLSQFDSRGAGIIDAVNFMYAGRSVYEGNLWPHNATIQLNYGGLRTHFYMLTSMGRRQIDLSIGTFCHESGHLLCRFPDLYDYGKRDGDFEKSQGIGRYCLMGSGNHNDRGRSPSPVCAYLRDLVGWADREILLNSPGDYEAHYGDYGSILKYETHRPNEYFLVENRSQLGLDAHLPASGLAIYHCDTLGSNEWQGGTAERHYQCGLLQADGHLDLENNRNDGDAGDLFEQVDGVALAHDTVPSSRAWDGADSELTLSDVTAPGEVIGFRVGAPVSALVVTGDATADLLIPDDAPAGVSSVIDLHQAGQVKGIKVGVDIIHPWIGDLQVELESPSGKKALLHDRTGHSQDDLRQTYTADTTPALAALAGEPVAGPWTLHVRDLARRDTGRLNTWHIEIEYELAGHVVEGQASPNLVIPDADNQGVSSAIAIAPAGQLDAVTVSVEISHTFIGDLLVELVAPSGQGAVLHNRSGGGRDDLRFTYDVSSAPALAALVGQGIQGEWVLQVRDLARFDTGTLESWSLALTYS